jgi:hypothetical protein
VVLIPLQGKDKARVIARIFCSAPGTPHSNFHRRSQDKDEGIVKGTWLNVPLD